MNSDTLYLIIAIIGCAIGIYGWYKGNKNDAVKDAVTDQEILREIRENVIKISVKQEQQCSAVSEIQTDIKATRSEIDTVKSRLMRLEMRVENLEHD